MHKLLLISSLLFWTCVFAYSANVKPTTTVLKAEDAAKLEQRVNKLLPKGASQVYFFVYGYLVVLEPTKTLPDKPRQHCLRFEESRYTLSKDERAGYNIVYGDNKQVIDNDITHILQVLAIGAGEEKAPIRREAIKGLPDPNSLETWMTRSRPDFKKNMGLRLKAEPKGIRINLS